MAERRRKKRTGPEEHPLAAKVKLHPSGPAIDRRAIRRAKGKAPQPSEHSERERITLLLDSELIDRLRNAVYWSDGITLAGLVADSLTRTVDRMERVRGESFPRRKAELPTGRPRKGNE